jgi:cobalt/nickel transport system permease protein
MSGTLSISDFLAVEESLYGRRAHGLRLVDARIKLRTAVALVLANVLWAEPRFSAALLAFCWILMAWTRVQVKQALWFLLAPAWATALVVLGFSVGFGHEALGSLGPLTFYREGLMQGLAAGLRVLAEMGCAAALMLSTPFSLVLNALRWYRLPEPLVETLGFMYRYVFMLFDEAEAMRDAARSRGGFASWRDGLQTTGQILAHLFIRAYDRAFRVALAMRARGSESES